MHDILESQDLAIIYQNEQIYKFFDNFLDIEEPDYQNINQLISIVNSSITYSMRFAGTMNYNMNNLLNNLVCYPRICSIIPSFSSSNLKLISEKSDKPTLNQICSNLFNKQNFLVDCNPDQDKYISCCLTARGDVFPRQISESIKVLKSKKSIDFVDYVPTGMKIGLCQKQPKNFLFQDNESQFQRDAILLANNTSISSIFQIMAGKFDKLYEKRAFVHYFVGEGMESDEFACAREELQGLIRDYVEVAHYTILEDNDYEEDLY